MKAQQPAAPQILQLLLSSPSSFEEQHAYALGDSGSSIKSGMRVRSPKTFVISSFLEGRSSGCSGSLNRKIRI